jgi:hypothetical protein
LVGFADYRALEKGVIGHPHGLEWFCSTHQEKAQALAHLALEEAVRIIRAREGRWWKKWFAAISKRIPPKTKDD